GRAPEGYAAFERLGDGTPDRRIGMTVEPGGLLDDEIGVAMTVDVLHVAALAARQRQRKRRIEEHRARVPTRHPEAGRVVEARTLRVGRSEPLFGVLQGSFQVVVDTGGVVHGTPPPDP